MILLKYAKKPESSKFIDSFLAVEDFEFVWL